MIDDRDNLIIDKERDDIEDYHCACECCHCKKIFMMLVVLILVFMAGIMVGNCGRCHYASGYYDNGQYIPNRTDKKTRTRAMQRGMHPVSNANGQIGGFIVEID